MPSLHVLLAFLAMGLVSSLFFARMLARRSGVKLEKEPWIVFGGLAGSLALTAMVKENVWVSLLSLGLVSVGLIHHARQRKRWTQSLN